MERITDKISKLSYAEQRRYYESTRVGVRRRLNIVQKLYGNFQAKLAEKPTILDQITEKGFQVSINEMQSHVVHLDKKLNMLNIIIRDDHARNQTGN